MIPDEELARINVLTEKIIGCAIEVHRGLGPGLLEQTYEAAMCIELSQWGMAFERQAAFPIDYKGIRISEHRDGRVLRTGVRRFLLDHLRASAAAYVARQSGIAAFA